MKRPWKTPFPRSAARRAVSCLLYWLTLMAVAGLTACGGGTGTSGTPSLQTQTGPQQTAAMAFTSDKLAVGLKDEPYTAQLEMAGGVPPYTYAIVDGELPPGLALDNTTGEVAGRPARVGEFTFTVRSQDAAQQVSLQQLTIYIDESAGTASTALGLAPRAASTARAQPLAAPSLAPAAAPDVSGLLTIVAGMAEGEWRRVNLNSYSSVWTPADLRPLYFASNPDPSRIILAWSGFAWDSNRAALLLYGGGHANYRGNDVYLWRASSQMWERASLPSAMVQTALGHWNAIDGADKAPASAHTYDNTIFLPILDRMLVLGGAADPSGGHYLTQATATTSRATGPYLFDPSRAHTDKVGGSTGSHVQRVAPYPEVVGGNMWSNRESWLNASATSTPPTDVLSNGCTGYAVKAGRDVVYLRTASRLYRYEIKDLANPAADIWKKVGQYYYGGSGGQSTCGYDPVRKIFLSTHASKPFIFWNLANPGSIALDTLVTPTDPSGEFLTLWSSGAISLPRCGLEFDPVRNNFKLWCGDGRVWTVTPPPTLGAVGWTIVKAPQPASAVPTEGLGTGILGKWKYVPNLDVFMGLADAVQGNIWIYKPLGWVNPAGTGNLPPSVSITAPANGASFTVGETIAVSAVAADGDGSVAKVEFFAGASKIGEATAAPFSLVWTSPPLGTSALSAIATDDKGASTTSAAVSVTVTPSIGGTATVMLQRGSGPFTVAETYLSAYHKTLNFGTTTNVQDQSSSYSSLMRFAIFQSEGGPVPNGARITSATLSLYKYSSYNMVFAVHRVLQAWSESTATWNLRIPGVSWSTAGANGLGTDIASAPDASASTNFDPGWINFDLTSSVQEMSLAPALANYGWRLKGVSGYRSAIKRMYSSEFTGTPSLRPKLTIVYE